jgi:hypothetical protein
MREEAWGPKTLVQKAQMAESREQDCSGKVRVVALVWIKLEGEAVSQGGAGPEVAKPLGCPSRSGTVPGWSNLLWWKPRFV